MPHPPKLSPSELLAQLKREQQHAPQPTGQLQQLAQATNRQAAATAPTVATAQPVAPTQPVPAIAQPQAAADVQAPDRPPVTTSPAVQSAPAQPVPHATQAAAGVQHNTQLTALFDRVNTLLGDTDPQADGPGFYPRAPQSIKDSGLTSASIERLVLKLLYAIGQATGRDICSQIKLPYPIVEPLFKQLKQDMLITFAGAGVAGDYNFIITERGRDRGRRYTEECTYFGAAPVCLNDYLKSMSAQSIAKEEATVDDLKSAFSDLLIDERMLDRLGPAVNSGRGMFLFGEPGNGKTSIAERITRAFGSTIWIPRAMEINGDIVRLFDPGVHEEVKTETKEESILDTSGVDQRWVQVIRPTVVAGGELTMQELEVTQNNQTKICEAPLQLKSNCGTLVIDDFGRQRMPVEELLNRWIVPLEKRYDFLNMPSGVKVQVPFDQLIVFSTNLEPKDLVDGAFLRRIPYKIEVPDPSEAHFRKLCHIMAPKMGLEVIEDALDYLVQKHYLECDRPFRACQPRDLMLQVRNFCIYKRMPKRLTRESLDFAVENYFSVM